VIFRRFEYYSTTTQKKEKVHGCSSGRMAFPLSRRRRYRMISPFLFSKKTSNMAIPCPAGGYAGRREDGACFRL
jgi:hypothetical protein